MIVKSALQRISRPDVGFCEGAATPNSRTLRFSTNKRIKTK